MNCPFLTFVCICYSNVLRKSNSVIMIMSVVLTSLEIGTDRIDNNTIGPRSNNILTSDIDTFCAHSKGL